MTKMSSVMVKKKFSAHGRDSINLGVPPDEAIYFIIMKYVLKCKQMLLNIDFCSPEPKMPSNINIGPH